MSHPIPTLTTQELARGIAEEAWQVIDVRPADAYNGWRLQNEPRGGHIKGARSLPHKWLRYIDWIEIVRSKQLQPNEPLVVYGYSSRETEAVARQFIKAGFSQVRVYADFVSEWSPNAQLPVEAMPRYRQLVPATWLKQVLDTGQAPEYENSRLVLAHAHYQNENDYHKGHIPGAIALDTNWLESEVTWNRRPPEELKPRLENLGITADTTVVLYGRFNFPKNDDPFPGSSAGHLGAIRCAFILLQAGVHDVRVLNGGIQSWQDTGFSLSTEPVQPQPAESFGAAIPGRPDLVIDTPQAHEYLANPRKNLISVRSWPEYIGQVSGYHYIEKTGRIPGSVFGNCGSDAYHMENYRNLDHTTREYHEIEDAWAEAGLTPDDHHAFYCGTGWRGSEAFFNAWLLAWPHVAVYDGGWFEWSNDPDNPTATGIPADH